MPPTEVERRQQANLTWGYLGVLGRELPCGQEYLCPGQCTLLRDGVMSGKGSEDGRDVGTLACRCRKGIAGRFTGYLGKIGSIVGCGYPVV